MKKKLILSFFMLILSVTLSSYAGYKEIQHSSGQKIQVTTVVGRTTEIVFPASVARIVTGISQQTISMEQVENRLFIQPLIYAPQGDIFVITHDGVSYHLFITTGAGEADTTVKISSTEAQAFNDRFASKTAVLKLMKAIMTNSSYGGSEIEPVLPPFEVYRDRFITLSICKIYKAPPYEGYVLLVRNITSRPLVIPIQQIYFSNKNSKLLAISSDAEELKKKGHEKSQTYVYIIVGKQGL